MPREGCSSEQSEWRREKAVEDSAVEHRFLDGAHLTQKLVKSYSEENRKEGRRHFSPREFLNQRHRGGNAQDCEGNPALVLRQMVLAEGQG